MGWILGMDIGGTNTRIGLVDPRHPGQDCACRMVSSRTIETSETAASGILRLIEAYLQDTQAGQLSAVSIGVPSAVFSDFKTVFRTPNLLRPDGAWCMDRTDLATPIGKALGIPVFVNKDVNNLLFCDASDCPRDGTYLGVYYGTGLGAAVLINGKMLLGRHGFAMDVGHLPVYHNDSVCGCGKVGCAETLASGTRLARLRQTYYPDTPFEDLFTIHGSSEPVQAFLYDCAHEAAILTTVFDPDVIFIGGGIVEMPGFPCAQLRTQILELTECAIAADPPQFRFSVRRPERGVIGAAIFAAEHLFSGGMSCRNH